MTDTHFACEEQLKKLGGKTPCCECFPHPDCELAQSSVKKTDKSIQSSEPMYKSAEKDVQPTETYAQKEGPMQKPEWEDSFDIWLAAQRGTAGFEQKLFNYISKVAKAEYERGVKECIVILEMNLDTGDGTIYGSSEVQYKNRILIESLKSLLLHE